MGLPSEVATVQRWRRSADRQVACEPAAGRRGEVLREGEPADEPLHADQRGGGVRTGGVGGGGGHRSAKEGREGVACEVHIRGFLAEPCILGTN